MKYFIPIILFAFISCAETKPKKEKSPEELKDRLAFVTDSLLSTNKISEARKLINASKSKIQDVIFIDSLELLVSTKKDSLVAVADTELSKIENKLDIETDEFRKIKWIYPDRVRKTYGNKVYAYFGIKDGEVLPLRFVIRYYGDNWLFWEQAIFLIDGESYHYNPYKRPNTDNSGGSVWETSDEAMTSTALEIITQMINAKEIKYRLSGDKYKNFTLQKKYVIGMQDIVKYHTLLSSRDKLDQL